MRTIGFIVFAILGGLVAGCSLETASSDSSVPMVAEPESMFTGQIGVLRRQVSRHAADEAQLNPCFAALDRSLVVLG